MARLSSCPNCWRQVLLPPGAARGVRVRCPLCRNEFELTVVQEAELPELVLLDAPRSDAEHALSVEPSALSPAEGSGSRPSSHVLDDDRGHERLAADEGRLGRATLSESSIGAAELPTAADGVATAESPPSAASATADEHSFFPSGGEAEFHSEAFNFYASPAAHGDAGSVEIAARPGKRRETNMAVELVKIVLGGAVGLVIAYAVLLYFFRIDPLGFAKSLPPWMVPASLESSEESP